MQNYAKNLVDKSTFRGNLWSLFEVSFTASGKENSYTYDARGNRLTENEKYGGNSNLTSTEYFYYENSDLIKKAGTWYFNYDKNGNLIAKGTSATEKASVFDTDTFVVWIFSQTQGELWTYDYDLQNRMVKASYSDKGSANLKERSAYVYDYRGLLVKKTYQDYVPSNYVQVEGNQAANSVTEFYEYTPDGRVIYNETKEGDNTKETTYIWANQTLWCQTTDNVIYYHHTDHLGTTEVIKDCNGTVVWEAGYEAFGSVLSERGDSSFTPIYTGKFFDKSSGLYYFNARWYDSELGRFTTEDPARDGANWYGYCNGNPVMFVDNDGCIADYFWDAASLAAGAVSFGYNIHHGNTKEAIFDAIGMVADAAALAIPLVPGGIGIARKGLVATKIVADTVGGVDAVVSGGQSVVEGIQNGNLLEAGFGAFQAITGAGQTGMAVKKGVKAAKANKRLNQMIKSNKAYNVSPESWFMEYNTLGRKGTFITDDKALKDILGDFELGSQKLDKDTISRLEKLLGLNKGSLSKSGFRITEINNITDKNPRIPTQDMGNQFFRFGEGLPGGGPELVIDPIPTGGK